MGHRLPHSPLGQRANTHLHRGSLGDLELLHFKQTTGDFSFRLVALNSAVNLWEVNRGVCLLLQSQSSLQAVLLNCKIHLPLEPQHSLQPDCLRLSVTHLRCDYTLLWSRLKRREELLLITPVMRL